MRQRSSAEQRTTYPALRKLAGAIVVVLSICLPALLAFVSIDAPVDPHELERVKSALFPEQSGLSEAARMFYGSTLTDSAIAEWPKSQVDVTVRARLSGMLALFAISALIYLILAQVRGRATGVIGSLSLATLVPIADNGHLLRPEQGATMFGLLGVGLMVGLPVILHRRRRRGVISMISPVCLIFVVGTVFGLAMGVHQRAWIYLALPAMALLVSVLALAFLFPRAIRGLPLAHWPLRAAARRYLPWMFAVLACSTMSLLVLVQSGGEPDKSSPMPEAVSGLLPQEWWWSVPLLLFAGIGAARMGYGVSLRLQRLRRVRPDTILFLYVSAMLMQYGLHEGSHDHLPAAAAMACLLGDGVMTAVVLVLGRLRRR